jgi:hypothetical protein
MNNKSQDVVGSFLYTILAILGGIVILFFSVTRAGFELMAKDNNENKLRNNLIEFSYLNDNGEKEEFSYLLPTTNTLPNSPFYGFKKVRDYLWLKFSRGELNKCKTAFLLADKKMIEGKMLMELGETNMAIEASQEALEKLKYTKSIIPDDEKLRVETDYIRDQVYMAGLAYESIVKKMQLSFENESTAKNLLEKNLNEFNQENKKERQGKTI